MPKFSKPGPRCVEVNAAGFSRQGCCTAAMGMWMSGMPFPAKQAQIPLHSNSAQCGDILVQFKVAHHWVGHEDLVLDFPFMHPRIGSSTLHPKACCSRRLKTENTYFRMSKLVTFLFSFRLIHTANSRTTLWLTVLRRFLVFLSHHPRTQPIRRLTLFPRKWALRFRAYRFGLGQLSQKLRPPASYPTVRPLPALWNKPTASNLPSSTNSLCTTNRVSALHVFLYVCACSVTTSVSFLFVFTYAACPCVYFPMPLSCILCSYNCTAFCLSIHSSF
jgi:hypothetical protein